MDRLISMAINAELDGISFTSAPAVASMLGRAKATGRLDELLAALRAGGAVVRWTGDRGPAGGTRCAHHAARAGAAGCIGQAHCR